MENLQWSTTDIEIKGPSAENPELSKIPSFKPRIQLHALPAASNSAFLISACLIHSASFAPVLKIKQEEQMLGQLTFQV